jgi:hypothetical protein
MCLPLNQGIMDSLVILWPQLYFSHMTDNCGEFLEADSKKSYKMLYYKLQKFEPRHDKNNIVVLQPAWIQTSLRISAV